MIDVKLSQDEINLLLSSIGLVLNLMSDPNARHQLEALQTKLTALRYGN
jgi:hypothetical protein